MGRKTASSRTMVKTAAARRPSAAVAASDIPVSASATSARKFQSSLSTAQRGVQRRTGLDCLVAPSRQNSRASLIRARVWRMARRCVCLLAAGAQQACGTRVPVVRHDALLHANGTLRLDTSVVVPRFDPGPEAVAYMREQARE